MNTPLKVRRTKKGRKVYDVPPLKNGKIAFRRNDKSDKFGIILTRKDHSQTCVITIPESEIEDKYNLIVFFDDLCKTGIAFENYLRNINSKDGEFTITGLTRKQYLRVMEEINREEPCSHIKETQQVLRI